MINLCGFDQIGVADRVDTIYRRTEWSNEYKGYGFEIADVCMLLSCTSFRNAVLGLSKRLHL